MLLSFTMPHLPPNTHVVWKACVFHCFSTSKQAVSPSFFQLCAVSFGFLAPNTELGTEWVIANVCWTQRNCLFLWNKCSLYSALDLSEINCPSHLWSWQEYLSSAKLVISAWFPHHIRNTTFHHQLLFSSKTLYNAQHPLGNQSKYNVFTASICYLECKISFMENFLKEHISFQNESLSTFNSWVTILCVCLTLSLSLPLSYTHTHTHSLW